MSHPVHYRITAADPAALTWDQVMNVLRYTGKWIRWPYALILVALGGMTSLPKERWWREAHLSPPFETAVLASQHWLPPEVSKRIRFR